MRLDLLGECSSIRKTHELIAEPQSKINKHYRLSEPVTA